MIVSMNIHNLIPLSPIPALWIGTREGPGWPLTCPLWPTSPGHQTRAVCKTRHYIILIVSHISHCIYLKWTNLDYCKFFRGKIELIARFNIILYICKRNWWKNQNKKLLLNKILLTMNTLKSITVNQSDNLSLNSWDCMP